MAKLSDEAIKLAKTKAGFDFPNPDESNDCVRIAYEWLDAQTKVRTVTRRSLALKHIIESWAGRYVSQYDVEVAAQMHPKIIGKYPRYNLSARLTEPAKFRLDGIEEAGKHAGYLSNRTEDLYKEKE